MRRVSAASSCLACGWSSALNAAAASAPISGPGCRLSSRNRRAAAGLRAPARPARRGSLRRPAPPHPRPDRARHLPRNSHHDRTHPRTPRPATREVPHASGQPWKFRRYGGAVTGPASRPLLFIDVDGPLIPFGGAPQQYQTCQAAPAPEADANPLLTRIDPRHGPRLRALACDPDPRALGGRTHIRLGRRRGHQH
jgi:hypothetical protein